MSKDPFLEYVMGAPKLTKHEGRAHSKFSASGAERWFNCPGSVELSEGVPDKTSKWAEEGTQAHEVLERMLRSSIEMKALGSLTAPTEMIYHGGNAADFILHLGRGKELLVENKIHLSFIHPEMFGTYDGAAIDYFDTLDVVDYKYGAGHAVSPVENLQMIFYAIGLAHKYQWNFKRVRLWIIQPRVKGYDGPLVWELSIKQLKSYVPLFEEAVRRVEENPKLYVEGSWCHWCKAKGKCPLKNEKRVDKAIEVFGALPQERSKDGKQEESFKKENQKESSEEKVFSEADWRKKEKRKTSSKTKRR